ncbi:hypothetical protein [Novosphingobium sp.]|uniref:hypothetical protein n=1 Tax=Novosphingobium sp. TaxID=1874826 RepID=UPI001D92DDCA|nr:hypothetical protein [Novosphingobium sp.]MBX9664890.1 hypothetical protein [Novosphingobium sp.]
MYELLFRSRWYALAWALFMAASAVMFSTTGAGAWLTSAEPNPQASAQARESAFHSWAEDDKRSTGNEGFDPSSPDHVRDGQAPRDAISGPERRTVPFSEEEAEGNMADASASR